MPKAIVLKIGLALALIVPSSYGAHAQLASRKLEPGDSYNLKQPIIFSDDFSKDLLKWELSIDAKYTPESRPLSTPLVAFVPDKFYPGSNAVRFEVPGDPGTFRSEIALPAENGIHERWYGERIMLEKFPAPNPGYIVMQWHAVQGPVTPGIAAFPNLAIWIQGDQWKIVRAFGSPIQVRRDSKLLDERPKPGEWTSFVLHIKWSKSDDGEIQLWQNDKLVWNVKGVNLYTDHATDVTPYLKTGIYRPSRKETTTTEAPTVVYVADVKIGREDASYATIAPPKAKVSAKKK